jgi:hypothetical protein
MALVVASPSLGQSALTLDDALNNKGLHAERSYFSPEPYEHFDTMSGNVVLTFTDLALPGNAGRELRFQRTYNNQHYQSGGFATGFEANSRWVFGFPGMVMRVFERAIPDPPDFTSVSGIVSTTPSFIMADGSWLRSVYIDNPEAPGANPAAMEVVSQGFYRYDRQNHALRMPDGTVCYYDPTTGRLVSFHDQFNNLVELAWGPTSVVITQHVGALSRQVTLALDASARVTSMSYEGRQWTYQYGYEWESFKDITQVVLPEGLKWMFTYEN